MNHSEASICEQLNLKYINNCRYKLANKFIFRWESDFFVQKENGYSYEFEVKISRSDFFSDKNKIEKHLILEKGIINHKRSQYTFNPDLNKNERKEWFEEKECNFRPNKFFYVVPKGMISVNEVPSYAGLMYVDEYSVITVKQAPFIHRDKLKFENILCNKFYHYWLNSKQTIRELERKVEYLSQQVNK